MASDICQLKNFDKFQTFMPELLHIHTHSHVKLTLIAKIHRKTADKGDNENKNVW